MNRITIPTFFAVLLFCCSTLDAGAQGKPFTIPEIREWVAAKGMLKVGANPQIKYIEDSALAAEEYCIKISRSGVKAYVSSLRGRKWAESTIRQMAAKGDGMIPCGTIHDWPEYPIRGFVLDVGRKYFPIECLYAYIDELAYYKMNTFHIHINDEGMPVGRKPKDEVPGYWRLQSDFFPGLAVEGESYSKQEYIDLQKYAESKGVEIITEFDTPAHSKAITQYRPDLGSKTNGTNHLDLFLEETYNFVDSLFLEYLGGDDPVIRGHRFHIGTDEYHTDDQRIREQFRVYTNHYLELAELYGKQACCWGSLSDAEGETHVDGHGRMLWAWYNLYADPEKMIDLGFDLVSIPDGLVYIVPQARYYNDYLDRKKIYDTWTPAVIGSLTFEENHPNIKGGMFAVWNDLAAFRRYTTDDVHDRAYPAIQVISAKTWSGIHTSFSFEEFDRASADL